MILSTTGKLDYWFYHRTVHNLFMLQSDRPDLFQSLCNEVTSASRSSFLLSKDAQGSLFLRNIGILDQEHCLPEPVRQIFTAHFVVLPQNELAPSTHTTEPEEAVSEVGSECGEPPFAPEDAEKPVAQAPEPLQLLPLREPMMPPVVDWKGFINQVVTDREKFKHMVKSGGLEWSVPTEEFSIRNPTLKRVLFKRAIEEENIALLESVFNVMNRVDIGEAFGLFPPPMDGFVGRYLFSKLQHEEIRYLFLAHLIPRGAPKYNYAKLAHELKAVTDEEFVALQEEKRTSSRNDS